MEAVITMPDFQRFILATDVLVEYTYRAPKKMLVLLAPQFRALLDPTDKHKKRY